MAEFTTPWPLQLPGWLAAAAMAVGMFMMRGK